MSSTKTVALKTYQLQDLTLGGSSSTDQNVWHGNKALSVKQGEQNANWQSSNSVQQNIHTKETFLWSVIHPLLKISFVWYSCQEKKISYRPQNTLKLPYFILSLFSSRTRQLFYSAVALLFVTSLCSVNIAAFKETELLILNRHIFRNPEAR